MFNNLTNINSMDQFKVGANDNFSCFFLFEINLYCSLHLAFSRDKVSLLLGINLNISYNITRSHIFIQDSEGYFAGD